MRTLRSARLLLPAALAALALVAACSAPAPASAAAALPLPPADATAPVHLPGLHNVVTYADGLVSGSVPEGEQGFATLARLGIRTIVSVDGATPDLELAERHGLRYVHLPIGYDGVASERGIELAQAISNLPLPVYLHCHHGKHRSAAGLGVACVLAGKLDAATAEQRMRVSGTAADYQGLWASVRAATAAAPEALQADPARFPKVAKVSGLVALMTALDVANDDGKALQQGNWQPLADHPDLVPAAVAKRLHELLQQVEHDPESQQFDAPYHEALARSIDSARALAAATKAGDGAAASAAFAGLGASCKQCHKTYRDQAKGGRR